MSVDYDCVIIGAGVVGLAIAKVLSEQGREVLILEKENNFGQITSARNSEVIHAGIYYPNNSLKARLCVQGRDALYQYCQERGIAHQRCGKLIVATNTVQLEQLAGIKQRALANGVRDIRLIDASNAVAMEPELYCSGALYSPSTGIIDSHGLMLSLLGDAENRGATLSCRSTVNRIMPLLSENSWSVEVDGDESVTLTCNWVINAAGHGACSLLNKGVSVPEAIRPRAAMLKGNYFQLTGKAPFKRLVYPVPEEGGLGVHMTLDLAGQARFGPDVEPVDREDYAVDAERAQGFYAAIRQYWPGLPDNSLAPDYAGIRPRVKLDGTLYPDFLIQTPGQHGLAGLISLTSIESPGLTACLAIAGYVADQV